MGSTIQQRDLPRRSGIVGGPSLGEDGVVGVDGGDGLHDDIVHVIVGLGDQAAVGFIEDR